ncbi:MAG TPA: c-type cytochrome [Actinoallomurus sp.]|nr:c-type cytochrome [Actinoallomurus sp.]
MKWFTAWRRRPWAGYAVVLAALAIIGVAYAGASSSADRAQASDTSASAQDAAKGKELFNQNCSSCHGANAEGTRTAPSLIGVGAASVDFQVGTGRMPASNPGAQIPRKKPIFNKEQIQQIAAYVASLGGGPPVPSSDQVDPAHGDSALGGELFRANCAQCHNFAGSGGALTGGKYAPPLDKATPTQIYEAMITGPQAMPVFNDTTITPAQKRAIIAYVTQTRDEPNPGGSGLGRVGPVAEGLVGWLVGVGFMVVAAMWLTARKPKKKQHND